MGLKSVGGKLLAISGRLVDACCCGPKKQYDCVTTGVDSCGRAVVECQKVTSGGKYTTPNCDGLCPLSPPCECNPPCDGCSECVDGVCEPTYGGCEECVNGTVQSACGECEICIDGQCVPCPSGYECVDGVCCSGPDCDPPPGTYYCCYEYDDTVSPGSPEEPRNGVTSTYCFNGPCGTMIDNVFVPQAWRTAGGPYDSSEECEDNCQKHNCVPDACNNYSCVPDSAGAYLTKEDCDENCDDPSGGQCALSPDNFTASGTGAGVQSYFFSVGSAAFTGSREICVAYASTTGRPIRVQIWSPDMGEDGCTQIASRTIKGDSQWRCEEECSCDFDAPGGCKGAPKGFVKWRTKQKNVTTFEVQVRTECADNEWQIGVTCGACMEMPEIDCCCGPCTLDAVEDTEERVAGDHPDTFVDTTYSSYPAGMNEEFYRDKLSCDPDDYAIFPVTLLSQLVNAAKKTEYEEQCYRVYFWVDMSYTHYSEGGVDAAGLDCFSDGWTTVKKIRAFVSADCSLTLEDKTGELLTQTRFESDECDEPSGCDGNRATPVYKDPKTPAVSCVNPLT